MKPKMEWDTREFEKALAAVIRESDRSDHEIVTMNARTLLKSTVYNTPRDTGTARAGYWPAWKALDMAGSPGTRRRYAPWKKGKHRLMVPQGRVDDQRDAKGEKYVEWGNTTHYRQKGKRVNYPYIRAQKDQWLEKAEEEATFKFGRAYEKLLKKHGKL